MAPISESDTEVLTRSQQQETPNEDDDELSEAQISEARDQNEMMLERLASSFSSDMLAAAARRARDVEASAAAHDDQNVMAAASVGSVAEAPEPSPAESGGALNALRRHLTMRRFLS